MKVSIEGGGVGVGGGLATSNSSIFLDLCEDCFFSPFLSLSELFLFIAAYVTSSAYFDGDKISLIRSLSLRLITR